MTATGTEMRIQDELDTLSGAMIGVRASPMIRNAPQFAGAALRPPLAIARR
jgi:hypothetical protein